MPSNQPAVTSPVCFLFIHNECDNNTLTLFLPPFYNELALFYLRFTMNNAFTNKICFKKSM